MALIKCAECGKEISDKSKKCIHCGNPIVSIQEEDGTQKVELTGLDIKGKNLKKTIVSLIIILVVVVGGIFVYNLIQTQADEVKLLEETKEAEAKLLDETNTFIENVDEVRTLMLLGAIESETVSSLIHDIWYNTIFKVLDNRTEKYTTGFNTDFNTSLSRYFNSKEYTDAMLNIDQNQESVKELMKKLQNPPEGLENLYTTITELHEVYLTQCNNASSPTGSLQSYTASINESASTFMNLYEILETQIPDITNMKK